LRNLGLVLLSVRISTATFLLSPCSAGLAPQAEEGERIKPKFKNLHRCFQIEAKVKLLKELSFK